MGFSINESQEAIKNSNLSKTNLYVTCKTILSTNKDPDNESNILISGNINVYNSKSDYDNDAKCLYKERFSTSTSDLNSNYFTQWYDALKASKYSGCTFIDDL